MIVFTDLVASTPLQVALGDRTFEHFRRRHFDELRASVREHGGTDVKSMGDGLMLTFTSVLGALNCCRAMHRAVSVSTLREYASDLAIRVSLHAGEVTFFEGDVYGTPVVVAQRLNAAASGGQILTSRLVKELIEGHSEYDFVSLGAIELKGFAAPIDAYEVGWKTSSVLPAFARRTTHELPFVGRDTEMDKLHDEWRRAAMTGLRIAIISGEPGIGKSELVRRFAQRVYDEGHRVLFGACDEDVRIPYQPVPQLIRNLDTDTARPGSSSLDLYEQLGGSLRGPTLDEHSIPGAREDAVDRLKLFDAVAQRVRESCGTGLLIVLDDVQWAGQGTSQLLLHVMAECGSLPILVLMAYRDTELSVSPQLSDLLARSWRAAPTTAIELTGLSFTAVSQLVRVGGESALDDRANEFFARTGGNALYVSELVRHSANARAVDETMVPASLKDIIRSRVRALGPDAEEIFGVASVYGSQFELAPLALAAQREQAEVMRLIEASLTSRLVVEVRDRIDRFSFCHALMREAMLDGISASRRSRLHLEIARALESLAPDDMDPLVGELAHHYCAAGPLDVNLDGVVRALQAAELATASLAFDEAIRMTDRACRHANDTTRDTRGYLWRAHMIRSAAHLRLGDREGAVAAATLALQIGRQLGDDERELRSAVALSGATSTVGVVDGQAVDALRHALESLDDRALALRSVGVASLARALFHAPDRQEALSLASEAVSIARQVDDPAVLAEALSAYAVVHWNPYNASERSTVAAEIFSLAERADRADLARGARTTLLAAHLEMGDVTAADEDLDVLEAMLDRHLPRRINWRIALARGGQALRRGQLADAQALADHAAEIGSRTGDPSAAPSINILRFFIARERGSLQDTEEMCRSQVERFPLIPGYRSSLGAVMLAAGRIDEAWEEYDHIARHDFQDLPHDANWLPSVTLSASVCSALGDTRRASILYTMLGSLADRLVTVGRGYFAVGSVAHELGLLAHCLGHSEDAARHYEDAAAIATSVAAPTWLVRVRLDQARLFAFDGGRARDLAASVLPLAHRLDLGTHVLALEGLIGE